MNEQREKLTDYPWVNLFKRGDWIFASRKDTDDMIGKPDAVVIAGLIQGDTADEIKIVLIKEYRYPIDDIEYGFPAGLIDDGEDIEDTIRREFKEETGLDVTNICEISTPIYSSAGISDESVILAFVECEGTPSAEYQEKNENIETLIVSIEDVGEMIHNPDYKFGAKSWPILWATVKAFDMGLYIKHLEENNAKMAKLISEMNLPCE